MYKRLFFCFNWSATFHQYAGDNISEICVLIVDLLLLWNNRVVCMYRNSINIMVCIVSAAWVVTRRKILVGTVMELCSIALWNFGKILSLLPAGSSFFWISTITHKYACIIVVIIYTVFVFNTINHRCNCINFIYCYLLISLLSWILSMEI